MKMKQYLKNALRNEKYEIEDELDALYFKEEEYKKKRKEFKKEKNKGEEKE